MSKEEKYIGLYFFYRGQNETIIAKIQKDGRRKDYDITLTWKSKFNHKEEWSEKDIKLLIKSKLLKRI